ENAFVGSLKSLFAVVENYPALKADQHFLSLQNELINTENRIQAARRFYNGNVREYNNTVQMFPSNLLAFFFDFKEKEYFEIDDSSQRLAPKAS
ncbi:MAG TPA: LemA family protein, partial [Candidatus Omnitrophota bacterium]|nr:LemA family protein [Candidatus Omnitrophota bacterium]